MKKYLILLLVIAFATSMLFMGISCKEEVPPAEEVVEEEEEVLPVEEEVSPAEEVVEEEVSSAEKVVPVNIVSFDLYENGDWQNKDIKNR